MSIGVLDGGLFLDFIVECEEDILEDSICLIDIYYDVSEGSMCCVLLVFCLLFFVSQDFMCESVLLVCDKGVMLYIYFVENDEDICYLLEKFGCWSG